MKYLLVLLHAASVFCTLCQFKSGTFYHSTQVTECFETIPLDPVNKQAALQVLARTSDLYPFRDLAANSPAPELPLNVDYLEELSNIDSKIYVSEYLFHRDLNDLTIKLRDAHSNYYMPTCYGMVVWYQPFGGLASYVDETGKQRVFIAAGALCDKTNNSCWKYFNLPGKSTDYVGAEILMIDQQDAFEYLTQFAMDQVSISKDPQVRFNIAIGFWDRVANGSYFSGKPSIQSPSVFLNRIGYSTSSFLPRTKVIEYSLKLANGTYLDSVIAPWVLKPLFNSTNRTDFKAHCTSGPTYSAERINSHIFDPEDVQTTSTSAQATLKDDKSRYNITAFNTSHFRAYTIQDLDMEFPTTLVWHIDSFEFPGTFLDFVKSINDTMNVAVRTNSSQLIFDLTNNGGGIVCWAHFLLKSVFGDHRYNPIDFVHTPLANLLMELSTANPNASAEYSAWLGGGYIKPTGGYYKNDTHWWYPGYERLRNGQKLSTSFMARLDDPSQCQPWNVDHNITKWRPQSTLILSEGFCGSSCSVFSSQATQFDGVRSVSCGGIGNNTMSLYSFPGGFVVDQSFFFMNYEQLCQGPVVVNGKVVWNVTSCQDVVPDPMSIVAMQSGFRFPFCEMYLPPGNQYRDLPLEFVYEPADFKLFAQSYEEAVFPANYWIKALPLFNNNNFQQGRRN